MIASSVAGVMDSTSKERVGTLLERALQKKNKKDEKDRSAEGFA